MSIFIGMIAAASIVITGRITYRDMMQKDEAAADEE